MGIISEAQARRGEEAEVDPEQFQDPDNEYGLFAGTTYEQDDEEADKIYEQVDEAMDARRRARRSVLPLPVVVSFSFPLSHFDLVLSYSREAQEQIELAKHRAERPKIQQQFADLKRGLSSVTDEEWENIPEVGNLTRKKRRREERSYAVPDSILVGDRGRGEYENSLDERQQQVPILIYYYLPSDSYESYADRWTRNTRRLGRTHQLCRNWTSP